MNKQEIIIYNGEDNISYNYSNKNISFYDKVIANNFDIIKENIRRNKKNTQIVLGIQYDPYPHMEFSNNLTRKTLEFIRQEGYGLTIITSSNLIKRDINILKDINKNSIVKVCIKLFSLDDNDLSHYEGVSYSDIEDTIKVLKKENIDVTVWMCPILPFINDDINSLSGVLSLMNKFEINRIIYSSDAVIINDKNINKFYEILDKYYSGLKSKYDSIRRVDYIIKSPKEEMVKKYLALTASDFGLIFDKNEILSFFYTYEKKYLQLSLF